MVSLAQLSTELGPALMQADEGPLPAQRLTGVHVSELEDPTPYLEGGELLLTTGMPLRGTPVTVRAYVQRLAGKGIRALGIGLGPWLGQVPPHLVEACRETDVQLLVVPDGVPFQTVSRAFWELSARSGQADLMSSLGTQTALARAATRPDATVAVVRGLAQALGGWAAYLPADTGEGTFWPESVGPLLPALHAEALRLNRAGTHSAATFELHGQAVVVYPIVSGARAHGFLAIGAGRTPTAADRQVVMTVCTLLALRARQREVVAGTTAVLGGAAAMLVLHGHGQAARLLAQEVGLGALPERPRVLALRAEPGDDLDSAAEAAEWLRRDPGLPEVGPAVGACALRHEEDGMLYLVLEALEGRADDPGRRPGSSRAERVAGALTEPVSLDEVPAHLAALRQAARHAPDGRLVAAYGDQEARAEQWAEALAAYPRADLVGTVTAYLRHRGHWEEAARELGVHRNSLRHRISVAGSLLGVDLNDPDVAAHLWLSLRRRGH